MLAIDFVVYNPHYQKYVYYEAVFEIDGAGFVVPSMSSSVRPITFSLLEWDVTFFNLESVPESLSEEEHLAYHH